MSTGLLFVTAPEADHKIINRLLLHLKDWQYESGDRFILITSKSIQALTQTLHGSEDATSAPVDPALVNEWAGASIAEVEKICLELDKHDDIKERINPHLFVVLDTKGIEDQACVVAERMNYWDPDPIVDEFSKSRVPWDQVYSIWCNLDIANMNWDEFMAEDNAKETDKFWWTFIFGENGQYLSAEKRTLRDEEIEKLKCGKVVSETPPPLGASEGRVRVGLGVGVGVGLRGWAKGLGTLRMGEYGMLSFHWFISFVRSLPLGKISNTRLPRSRPICAVQAFSLKIYPQPDN